MYILRHANSHFLSNCMLTDSLFHTKGRHISCRSLFQRNPPYRLNQWNIQTKFNIFKNRFVSKKGPQFYFVASKLTYTAHLCFVPVEPGTARCSVYTETIIDLYLCYIVIKIEKS